MAKKMVYFCDQGAFKYGEQLDRKNRPDKTEK